MAHVFICDGVRTPIGRYGGALAKVRTDDLAAFRSRRSWRAIRRPTGRSSTTSISAAPTRPARTIAMSRAWPCCWPVCRQPCPASPSTGFAPPVSMPSARPRAPSRPARSTSAIAGGVESMSRAPFVMGKATEAFSRSAEVFDTTIGWRFVNALMKQQYGIDAMPETAENVAAEFQVARNDQDAFALRSQQRAAKAVAAGFYAGRDHAGRDARPARPARFASTRTSIRGPTPPPRSWPSSRRRSARPAP